MSDVLLNHFYVTSDRATFEATETRGLLAGLRSAGEATTVRKDTTYTGLYLYGSTPISSCCTRTRRPLAHLPESPTASRRQGDS